jgi:hypothetical protein
MLTAARELRLPRFSKSNANTAAFDGWMKRTITVLYGAQLFLTVVKGVAVCGAALLTLFGIYRTQGRIEESRELIKRARSSAMEKVTVGKEALKRTTLKARAALRARVDSNDVAHDASVEGDPKAPLRSLASSASTAASNVVSAAKAKIDAARQSRNE